MTAEPAPGPASADAGPGRPAAPSFETVVGRVGAGGVCVGRAPDGRVVLVRHALPGERVRVVVTDERRSYLRADAVDVLAAAEGRVAPPCPLAGPGRCGGCDWQHADPPLQRLLKTDVVREHLRRLAGIRWDGAVEEVRLPGRDGAPGLGWRTRLRFAVRPDGVAGLHRHRSHEVQPVADCPLAVPEVAGARVGVRRWPGTRAVSVAVALRDGGPAHGAVLAGGRERPTLVEEVEGRRYRVHADGFWQPHAAAPSLLTGVVLDGLAPRPGDRALDLYCGAGLFTVPLADAVGASGRVLGIELDPRAVADARANLSGSPWARVRRAALASREVRGRWDVVVLDPPREGAGTALLRAVLATGARAVVYVSCDPASLARDLAVLPDAGWRVRTLRAFDLFPMTAHVECVAVLEPVPGAGPTTGGG